MFNSLSKCNNTEDFRLLAKSRLPAPIYHYIDGAADDEVTIKQNTKSYENFYIINKKNPKFKARQK